MRRDAAVDAPGRGADHGQQGDGHQAAPPEGVIMLPMLQLSADAMSDRALAMSAVVSMLPAEAEAETDVTSLIIDAERVADWIGDADTAEARHLRRTSAVLAARTSSQPRDLVKIAKTVARWLERG